MTAALNSLLDDFIQQASTEHRDWIARAASMARAMSEEGENDIALENFCENLAEWQCPIPADLYARLNALSTELGLDAAVVKPLQTQVR